MNLAACYLAVAACVGVPHPPKMPRVVIVADVPHMTDGQLRHGFVCGEYCLNPPPPCDDPAGCVVPPGYCTERAPAYCAGLYDNPPRRGRVTVSDQTLEAIPHEFIHHLVQKRRLFRHQGDPGDAEHVGPWWPCEHVCDAE